MSEKEREILQKLSEIVPKLPDTKKERLLGVAEGMSIVRESEREEEDNHIQSGNHSRVHKYTWYNRYICNNT